MRLEKEAISKINMSRGDLYEGDLYLRGLQRTNTPMERWGYVALRCTRDWYNNNNKGSRILYPVVKICCRTY
jgi:hypothetical protein